MEINVDGTVISLKKGDITKEETDAIVNAANSKLAGGGGVDGAIHKAGGPEIMAECRKIKGGCPTGSAVITTGGMLKARYVIHTVGPVYAGGRRGEAALLAKAYESSLKLAAERGIETVAFPSISTGAYGYPVEDAATTALKTVIEYAGAHKGFFKLIRFCLFSDNDLETYRNALRKLTAGRP
ncbi:MAG: O-acetyl-ADP-ribose deacetylase [Deltaproteobacteria bacterium]|nr:O-acetyl-ADP-ribose deacetylase [Deltaproteobacteria bacterium]